MSAPTEEKWGVGWFTSLTLGVCFYIWLAVLFSTTTYYVWVGIVTACCIAVAFLELRKARLIEDVPRSTIRAAAQGYVELQGRAVAVLEPMHSPLTGEACCWWSLEIDRAKKGGGWTRVSSTTSPTLIRLADKTGECLIDPKDAEVTGARRTVRFGKTADVSAATPDGIQTCKFVEELIPPDTALVAIGMFAHLPRDFPTDQAGDATDMLAAPTDGRHLLLSTFSEKKLVAYYRRGAAFMYKYVLVMLLVAFLIEQTPNALARTKPCADPGHVTLDCWLNDTYQFFRKPSEFQ